MNASVPAYGTAANPVTFCPACWERLAENDAVCPACGVEIARYLAENDYGAQLIAALRGPDERRRLMAASILGARREIRAIPALREIALTERRDVYLAKAAVAALGSIGGKQAMDVLYMASNRHPTRLVRDAAGAAFSAVVATLKNNAASRR